MPALVRPNVLRMTPYSPGKPIGEVQRELGLSRIVKLASNENPLGPSPLAVEAVKSAAERMHVYPDGASYDLRSAISSHFDLPAQNVIVGNGSDEIIHVLGEMFLRGPDDEVIVGFPSFVRYDAAAFLAESQLVRVPLDSEFRHDLAAMRAAISPRTKLVFIANPNNPTGTIIGRAEFDDFLDDLPDHVSVVLDEAYFEFAAHVENLPNSGDYVREGKPVIGLRTFSKAYGLAGLRLGYAFVPSYVADAFDRAREPFDVNSLAQAGGIAALGDTEHLARTLRNNSEGAERMAAAFAEFGDQTGPTFANFVWADLKRPAHPVFEALLRLGVIVRSGVPLGNPNCLRVTVGTPEEVDFFIECLLRCR